MVLNYKIVAKIKFPSKFKNTHQKKFHFLNFQKHSLKIAFDNFKNTAKKSVTKKCYLKKIPRFNTNIR